MSFRPYLAPHRICETLAVAGLLTILPPRAATAQVCDTTMTATLLKRLGEAVDGYRTGRPVWVAVSYVTPPEVLGVFASAAAARAVADSTGRCSRVFGPYLAQTDGGEQQMLLASGTHHWPDSRYDSTYSGEIVPLTMVVDITVITRLSDGREIRKVYRAGDVDALFFTMSAIDKFVIPYYERLYGVAYAAALRDKNLRAFRR